MKKVTIGLLAILLMGAFTVSAQQTVDHPPKVEILPGAPGILKILYVNEDEKKVKVNISGAEGLLFSDRIFVDENSKGFLKRYNLEEMDPGIYWVEVSNKTMTVKYQFDYLENKEVFAHYWKWTEKTPAETIIASSKSAR